MVVSENNWMDKLSLLPGQYQSSTLWLHKLSRWQHYSLLEGVGEKHSSQVCLTFCRVHLMKVSPKIKPARPVLHHHLWPLRLAEENQHSHTHRQENKINNLCKNNLCEV